MMAINDRCVWFRRISRTSRSYPPLLLRDRDITIHNRITVSTASVCTCIVYPLRSICSCGHVPLFYFDFLSHHTRRINNFKLLPLLYLPNECAKEDVMTREPIQLQVVWIEGQCFGEPSTRSNACSARRRVGTLLIKERLQSQVRMFLL